MQRNIELRPEFTIQALTEQRDAAIAELGIMKALVGQLIAENDALSEQIKDNEEKAKEPDRNEE